MTDTSVDWVRIRHPEAGGGEAEVTREAFDEVWSGKGWVLVEADYKTMKKGELQEAAREQGLDDSGTRDQLLARLTGTEVSG